MPLTHFSREKIFKRPKVSQKIMSKSFKFVVSSSFVQNIRIINCCSSLLLRSLHNGKFSNDADQNETVFLVLFCIH